MVVWLLSSVAGGLGKIMMGLIQESQLLAEIWTVNFWVQVSSITTWILFLVMILH